MIIVTAYIDVKRGKENEFVEQTKELIALTRQENGNISYRLFADTEDSARFTFLEQWESMDALKAHMQTTHFKAFGATAEELAASPADIKVYDANTIG